MTRRPGRAWVGRGLVLGVVAAVLAGTAVAAAAAARRSDATPADRSGLPPATDRVTRATLTQRAEAAGTLGFGPAVPVTARSGGTLTALAAEGSVVARGRPLYAVDGRPVVLLYGTLPAYRRLAVGTTGPDVAQLERNLRALGRAGFRVDDRFSAATATAVRSWQRDLGRPPTGAVDPAEVLVVPGAVRIGAHRAVAGDQLSPGTPLFDRTGTARLVTVALDAAEQRLVRPGAAVLIDLPGAGTVGGRVASVGTVARTAEGDGGAAGSGGQARSGGQAGSGGGAAAGPATVEVIVRLDDDEAAGRLDQAPVTVRFVAAQRVGVLTVPVAALLALREGGYGIEVVDGERSRVLAVRLGIFADGRVEITAPGLRAGTVVGIPAS